MAVTPTLRLLPRRVHVFFTAALVYLAIKSTQLYLRARKKLRVPSSAEQRIWSRTHRWCAARLLRLAMRRRALWLKLCQYLSSRADVLPPEYTSALEACLDAVPPENPSQLLELLVAELGGVPPDDIFDGFDPAAPIASASIAQVHRATLRVLPSTFAARKRARQQLQGDGEERQGAAVATAPDSERAARDERGASIEDPNVHQEEASWAMPGTDVVLKIQRPGVKQVLLQDLQDLTTIMLMVAGAEPAFDFRPMLQAWIDMVPLETDFIHEMRCGQYVSNTLDEARGTKFESTAFVPRTIPELTTERLLVMEYVHGCSVRDIEAMDEAGVDREQLVTEISKAFALQAHILGRINADCHPGNILVRFNSDGSPGGVPALIDFGITVELTERQRLGFCRTVLAAVDNNSFSLLQSFEDMGIVLNRADPSSAMDLIKHLFRSTASREDTIKQSQEFVQRQKERDKRKINSGIAVNGQIQRREENGAQQPSKPSKDAARGRWRRRAKKVEVQKNEPDFTRNPVDAFPGYLVFMFRTLALLRGLSSRLDVAHAYLPILSDYAQQAMYNACPESERMVSIVYPMIKDRRTPRSLQSRKAARLRKVLTGVLTELERRGLIVGCQVAAYLNGELVLDVAAGRMGKYNPRPVTPSSLFNVFSVSKGVMAILFAKLSDEYGVEYYDLVSKYWPAYACHGKESTTVAHILSHTAGLAQAAPEDMSMLRLRDDWRGVIDWFATEATPAHTPGTKQMYHYLSFGWLVAGLLHAVSGKDVQEHLAKFADELGVSEECYIGLPPELCSDDAANRVAQLHSAIFSDLEKIVKRRRQRQVSEAREAQAQSGSGATARDDQARNMERLYDENETPTDAVKFLYNQFFGRTSDGEEDVSVANVSLSEKTKDESVQGNMADVFSRTPYLLEPEFFSHPVMRAAVIPSANGHFSARALAKMFGMLSNDGRMEGRQVLKPGRVRWMMQALFENADSASGTGGSQTWHGDAYGAGLRLYDVVDKRGRVQEKCAMGHGGIGGSMGLCIPSHKFGFAFTCNQLNALSAAEAVVIAVVFRVLDIPMPSAYSEMMSRFRQEGFVATDDAFEGVERQIDNWLDGLNLMQAMTG